jgi:hypothetical protein
MDYPDDSWVESMCKIGQNFDTCRYLTLGARGWSCEKNTPLGRFIDRRVEHDEQTARGDNCEGLKSR